HQGVVEQDVQTDEAADEQRRDRKRQPRVLDDHAQVRVKKIVLVSRSSTPTPTSSPVVTPTGPPSSHAPKARALTSIPSRPTRVLTTVADRMLGPAPTAPVASAISRAYPVASPKASWAPSPASETWASTVISASPIRSPGTESRRSSTMNSSRQA